MPTMRLFRVARDVPVPSGAIMDYCVDGIHVNMIYAPPIVDRRVITTCDGSCRDAEIIAERELPQDAVENLRSLIGKVVDNGRVVCKLPQAVSRGPSGPITTGRD
ncbi:MAG TPA: hypothetical protein VJC13_00050 [Candidatus Paceibacterota bacterium]